MNEANSKEKDDQGEGPEECDATEADVIDIAGPMNIEQGIMNAERRMNTTSKFIIRCSKSDLSSGRACSIFLRDS